MTDREALAALAASEPEPFRQTRPTAADNARWQVWHDRYIEAMAHAEGHSSAADCEREVWASAVRFWGDQ